MFSSQVRDNSCHVQDIKFRAQSKDKTNVKYTWIVKPWAGFLPERRHSKQKQNSWFCFLKHSKKSTESLYLSKFKNKGLSGGRWQLPTPGKWFSGKKCHEGTYHWLVQTRLWVKTTRGFPGSPVVRTPHFHFRDPSLVRESGCRAAARRGQHTCTKAQKWTTVSLGVNSFQFHAPSLIESLLRGRYILKPVSKLSRGFSESASRSVMSNSCDPMDRSLPGSSVHGISQARILEWVAISFSGESSQLRDQTWVSCTAGRFFTVWTTRDRLQFSSVAQSCLTLCDPMNHSTPGFPVHHQRPESTQAHVHRVGDAIQPSHPLSSLLLLPSIFSSIRVFSNESALRIRWPKY